MNENYLLIVDISVHPDAPAITRKVAFWAFNVDARTEIINLLCEVRHYKDGLPYSSRTISNYQRVLKADKTLCNPATGSVIVSTNEQGQAVDKAGVIVDVPITLYQLYISIIMGGTVNIPAVVTQVIQQEDLIYQGFN